MEGMNIHVYIILGDVVKSAVVQGGNDNALKIKADENTPELIKAFLDAMMQE